MSSTIPTLRSLVASSSRVRLPFIPLSTLPTALPFPQSQSHSHPFSSSAPSLLSREKRNRTRRKRERNIETQSRIASAESSARPDPILGSTIGPDGKSAWDDCRLNRALLTPEQVYNTRPTNYTAGETPERFLPGLTKEDQDLLFGALPYVSVDLQRRDNDSLEGIIKVSDDEERKFEHMQRVLDLRNANKQGIEAVNRQRVIEEFGRREEGKGIDTGSSEVQAALLTHKIRSLAEHLAANRKDNANKRALRSLVHKRQQVLKYFARKNPAAYEPLLADLGLEKRAVEGEITL